MWVTALIGCPTSWIKGNLDAWGGVWKDSKIRGKLDHAIKIFLLKLGKQVVKKERYSVHCGETFYHHDYACLDSGIKTKYVLFFKDIFDFLELCIATVLYSSGVIPYSSHLLMFSHTGILRLWGPQWSLGCLPPTWRLHTAGWLGRWPHCNNVSSLQGQNFPFREGFDVCERKYTSIIFQLTKDIKKKLLLIFQMLDFRCVEKITEHPIPF